MFASVFVAAARRLLNGEGKHLSWRDAHRSCVVAGGDLISIHSKEEQDLAYELAKSAGVGAGSFGSSGIWIGFRRESAPNAEWGWSDGSPVDFKNFAPAQPDNAGGREFCADLLTMIGLNGQWNDYDCSGSKPPFGAVSYAICKRAANSCHAGSPSPSKATTEAVLHTSTTQAQSPSTAGVPSSAVATTTAPYTEAQSVHYTTTPPSTASHSTEQVSTSKPAAVSSSSTSVLSSVATTTAPPYSATKAQSVSISAPPSTGPHPTDKVPTSELTEKQPSSSGTTPAAPPTAAALPPIKCDNGLIIKNSFAYFWHEGPRDFWVAEKDCQRCGGHLVSLHSADEATFVNLNFVSKLAERYVWGGLYDAANGTKFPRQWTNTDGTPYDFWVWQPGQPDNYQNAESCMAYENGKYGTWDDVPCGYKSRFSICKKGPVQIV